MITNMPTPDAAAAPATSSQLTHPKYRPDIDGLRAVAVLSVVAFHAFPNRVRGGFIGVDIFFVISGFLISSILFENLERGTFSFTTFYSRRIRRIFPALLLVLLVTVALGWAVLFDDEFRQLLRQSAAGAAFLSNFELWQESGYFDAGAEHKPLLHLWSLGVEEQFYILWPSLVYLGWRLRANLLLLSVAVAAASFVLDIAYSDPIGDFYSPLTRFWELLSGAMLAYLAGRQSALARQKGLWADAASVVGMLLAIGGCVFLTTDRTFPGWWALIPTASATLLIAAGPKAALNRMLLARPIVVWFGLISYPLYLWHWPLLSYLQIVGGTGLPKLPILAAVGLAILLAWLTYRFVETPIRHSRSAVPVATLAAAMSVAAAITFFAYLGRVPARLGHDVLASVENREAFNQSRAGRSTSCAALLHLQPVDEEVCVTTSASPAALFVGDSHAMALFSAVLGGSVPLPAILVSGHDCEPYPALSYIPTHEFNWGNNCAGIAAEVVRVAAQIPSIRTVVIAPAARPVSDTILSTRWRDGNNPLTEHEALIRGTDGLLAALTGLGKNVVYVKDVPHFFHQPNECVRRLPMVAPRDCRVERAAADRARGPTAPRSQNWRVRIPTCFSLTRRLCSATSAGARHATTRDTCTKTRTI